jgi:hypothetical protein
MREARSEEGELLWAGKGVGEVATGAEEETVMMVEVGDTGSEEDAVELLGAGAGLGEDPA